MNLIKEARDFLLELRKVTRNMSDEDDEKSKDQLEKLWIKVKEVAMSTEQIIWALNSNKEHLRYLARIYVIPKVYKRTDEETIPLKDLYIKSVEECEQVIEICRLIRTSINSQLKTIYSFVNLVNPTSLSNN